MFKNRANQEDIISPIISNGVTIPAIVYGPFDYSFTVNENSYAVAGTLSAVAVSGDGMPVYISGCTIGT